jgi:16S rRNA A1518/A1519 N6-dimethyltransferase RsmA/KsgA/DIM1 with predicted DNA glycosylase/AP lyase activity
MLQPVENAKKYYDVVFHEFFDCINQTSNVLEIGPFDGWFSDLIVKKNPKTLTLVEPNIEAVSILEKKFKNNSNVTIINKNIFDYISSVRKFDVVIIFGVIYHMASPFDLLEKVINQCNPEYVCIDNPVGYLKGLSVFDELLNAPGSRYDSKKTVQMSICMEDQILVKAMNNLGYKSLHHRYMAEFEVETKLQTHIRKFKNDIQ